MPIHPELAPLASAAAAVDDLIALSGNLKLLLEQNYGMQFTILDGTSGKQLDATSGQPLRDWSSHAEILREVARRGRPEFIDDEDPFLTLALPLTDAEGRETVAVATILTRPAGGERGSFSAGESPGHSARRSAALGTLAKAVDAGIAQPHQHARVSTTRG